MHQAIIYLPQAIQDLSFDLAGIIKCTVQKPESLDIGFKARVQPQLDIALNRLDMFYVTSD